MQFEKGPNQTTHPSRSIQEHTSAGGLSLPAVPPLQMQEEPIGETPSGDIPKPFSIQVRTTEAQPVQAKFILQASHQVIQRMVLSSIELIESEDQPGAYWIADVIIGGRTPSPFTGTMGAHSTAWVAHIDLVRRHLVNTQFKEGIKYMLQLAEDERSSPMLALRPYLAERHRLKLEEASKYLKQDIDNLKDAKKQRNIQKMKQALKNLINSYLTFVNYLPLSTVAGGDPGGHGEGSARGEINLFEYVRAGAYAAQADKERNKRLTEELKQLSSKGFEGSVKIAAGQFSREDANLQLLLRERLWALFAAETPVVFMQASRVKVNRPVGIWVQAVRNFLRVIRTAYPYAYDYTKMQLLANQMAGLRIALKNAKVTDAEPLAQAITGAMTDKKTKESVESDEAAFRGEHDEVAASDFSQSGSGFQASIMLQEGRISNVMVIGAVEMIGRTKSPFSGTMGAHSVAWAAHLDAVRATLLHRRVPQAILALQAKAIASLSDQGLKYSNLLSEKHQIVLIGAFNYLKKLNAKATTVIKDEKDLEVQVAFLQDYIIWYLTYVNYLPMSTVEAGGIPGGRREGEHRTFLNNYELIGKELMKGLPADEAQALLQKHLTGMYDPGAVNAFPPALGQRAPTNFNEYLNDPFNKHHELYPFIYGKDKAASGKTDIAHRRLYHTLFEAYPRAAIDSSIMAGRKAEDGNDWMKAEEKKVALKEGPALIRLLAQNNCLINAIMQAAFGPTARVTQRQLLDIRLRVGQIGTMLFASDRVISIIRQVLNIQRGIVVIYQDRPSEDFGNTDNNPVMVEHTGAAHFVPYDPDSKATSDSKKRKGGGGIDPRDDKKKKEEEKKGDEKKN